MLRPEPLSAQNTQYRLAIIRDVRILQFCARRILRRICQHAKKNWPLCTQLTKRHRNCNTFADFVPQHCSYFTSVLTAATASTEHFGVKVIKQHQKIFKTVQNYKLSKTKTMQVYYCSKQSRTEIPLIISKWKNPLDKVCRSCTKLTKMVRRICKLCVHNFQFCWHRILTTLGIMNKIIKSAQCNQLLKMEALFTQCTH